MRAIVGTAYGSPAVFALRDDVDKPVVSDGRVLVRVRAASVNAYDWRLMRGQPYLVRMQGGLRRPKATVPGVDLAGVVEAVGANVTQFKPGDEVFGECGGAFAEYVCTRAERFALKSTALTFEQAAAIPMAGLTALQGLRDKAQVQPGQRVLVNGAAGGVGTFAVQIAKAMGADVTAVCSTKHVDTIRSIGADRVINYTVEDFTSGTERYDVIFDVAANHSFSSYRRVLVPGGAIVLAGAPKGRWLKPLMPTLKALVLSRFVRHRILPFMAKNGTDDLNELTRLVEAGKLTPVIDREFPLSEAADAVRYVEDGHPRGKVVITV